VVNNDSFLSNTYSGKSDWWFGRAAGNRTPYSINGTMKGQGGGNSSMFYPPSTENGWTSETGAWDGGAGGGGGAPWGLAGGYAEKSDSYWDIVSDKSGTVWRAPNESSGAGGNQGFCFLNSNYVNSYLVSQINTYYTNYGAGGVGGGSSGGFGQAGAIRVRVSNVDDGIYPS
jgi:hypothetical protein